MTSINAITVEAPDPVAAAEFYAAFGIGDRVSVRPAEGESGGFRGFALSLVVSQPSTVDTLVEAALAAGATVLKPVAKSFWGYGGVVQAPDGTIWKVASSSKKNTGPANRDIDDVVLLIGADDVKASKQFYVDQGMTVAKSFGSKYVEFAAGSGTVKLALYGRRAAAKDVGVSPDGSGSHRILIGSGGGAFTDPDGFVWERV